MLSRITKISSHKKVLAKVSYFSSLTQGQAKKEKAIPPVHNAYLTSIHQDLRYFAYIVYLLVLHSDIDWATNRISISDVIIKGESPIITTQSKRYMY